MLASVVFGLCILFFVVIILERLKPGMSFTKSLYVVWFYSSFGTLGYMAYKIITTGMI